MVGLLPTVIKQASRSLVTLTGEGSRRHFVPGTKWKTPGMLELFVCCLLFVVCGLTLVELLFPTFCQLKSEEKPQKMHQM